MWLKKRPHKFNARPMTKLCSYGHLHRSGLEYSVCDIVKLRELAGELKHVRHESPIRVCCRNEACLVRERVIYIADFETIDLRTGETLFIEAKGKRLPEFSIKLRLYRHTCVFPLEIWEGDWRCPKLIETVIPK